MTTIRLRAIFGLMGAAIVLYPLPNTAYAWGDERHKLDALVALKFLEPDL